MIFTEKAQRSTKDTKLDVDDASLCVLCVLFFSFVIKRCSFCSANGMIHVFLPALKATSNANSFGVHFYPFGNQN